MKLKHRLALTLEMPNYDSARMLHTHMSQWGFHAVVVCPYNNTFEVRVSVHDTTVNQGADVFDELGTALGLAQAWSRENLASVEVSK